GVLEVPGREGLVEAAELLEQPRRDEHAGGGAVIDLAPEAVLEAVRIATGPDSVRVSDRVHDRAGLLEGAVLVQVERHPRAGARLVERLEQRLQPAGLDECIAVEEAEVAPTRLGGALVRGRSEAAVDLVSEDL